jgi:outer membrane protein, heavy metal efflux system
MIIVGFKLKYSDFKKTKMKQSILKNSCALLIFFIFLYVPMKAQVLTYDSVKATVLNANPELKMYDNQAKAFEAMATGAKAWDAPQLSAGLFMTPYKSSYWQPQVMEVNGMQSMDPGMGSFMIQGRQMIPNPSRLNANQKYMQAMSSVELEFQKATTNNLLAQVKIYYSEIQITDRKLLILTEAERTLQTMIALGEAKIAYSQESVSNIYKAKSQLAILKTDRLMLENERKQKMYILNTLMNRSREINFQVDTTLVIKNYETRSIDTLVVFSSRSDLLALEKNIKVTQLKQKAEQYRSRPDFGIEYGHMFSFGQNPNLFSLMGMMSIPIVPWSSRMYKSTILAAQYQVKAMQNEKQTLVNESTGMLFSIQNELKSTKYQLELYRTMILPSLQKTYDVAMIAYSQNSGELFMALDARMNLQMAQMQYYEILLKVLMLQAEYEKQLQIY